MIATKGQSARFRAPIYAEDLGTKLGKGHQVVRDIKDEYSSEHLLNKSIEKIMCVS